MSPSPHNTADTQTYRELIQGNKLDQRLFEILTENSGIAPAWQVQTQLGHMQQLLDQGAGQGEIAAQLGADAGATPTMATKPMRLRATPPRVQTSRRRALERWWCI